jgi:hypothetical protein
MAGYLGILKFGGWSHDDGENINYDTAAAAGEPKPSTGQDPELARTASSQLNPLRSI